MSNGPPGSDQRGSGQQTGASTSPAADPVEQAKRAVGAYLVQTFEHLATATDALIANNNSAQLSPLHDFRRAMTRMMVELLAANVRRVVGPDGPLHGSAGKPGQTAPGAGPPPGTPPYPGE